MGWQTHQLSSAVFADPVNALLKWNLNVTIIDQHYALILAIVAHTLITRRCP